MMKRMFHAVSRIFKRQRGFTLVEMVTVVAIMGVMAAVAVPMVNNQLGKTREKSYIQDKALIQTAVDSFFTAADNVRHLGQRQFPINGSSISKKITAIPTSPDTLAFDETGNPAVILQPVNPLRGTQGGEPKWRDGTQDGNRKLGTDGLPVSVDQTDGSIPIGSGSEEALNNANAAFGNKKELGGWYVDRVTFQAQKFAIDSRSYIIDFRLLVDAGLLQNVPESASPDNGGGSTSGSYVWYIKESGQVQSLLFFLPSNGDKFPVLDDPDTTDVDESVFVDDPNTPNIDESLGEDGTVNTRGFQDGVYP